MAVCLLQSARGGEGVLRPFLEYSRGGMLWKEQSVCKWCGKQGLKWLQEPRIKHLVYLTLRIRCLRLLSKVANKPSRRPLKVSISLNPVHCVVLLLLFPELRGAGGGLCVCCTTLSLRAGADKLGEGLTCLDPAVPCLGWRSAPSRHQTVQPDLHLPLQGGGFKIGRCWAGVLIPFFSRRVSLYRQNYGFPVLYIDHFHGNMDKQEFINELRVGKKFYLSSIYTPVKPSWLKASTLNFCSPVPGNHCFCDFYFIWGLIILSFSKVSCQYLNRFSKR